MRISLLIILLFSILGGAHASTPLAVCSTPVFHLSKSSVHAEQGVILTRSVFPDTHTPYLVADTVEDEEDTNETIARKYKALARSLTSSYLFTLSRIYSCAAPGKPFSSLLSDKYIMQRVLRI